MKPRFISIGAIVLTVGAFGMAGAGTVVWVVMSHRPNPSPYKLLALEQQDEDDEATPQPASPIEPSVPVMRSAPVRSVVVNSQQISERDLAALELQSRSRIPNGNYWYDRVSGAWGIEGGPCS